MRYAPFHNDSDYVVQALEAARLQGKYWRALDAIYNAQPTWATHGSADVRKIWQPLEAAGIDITIAQKQMNNEEIIARQRQDMADVRQIQVTKTPGFFVNGNTSSSCCSAVMLICKSVRYPHR